MRRSLKFWPLLATIYFCVSGGPFGLEPLMQSGKGIGLLLILITPLIWALPAALMSAELTAAYPAEGGYYVWVKRALGPFAGYLCGIWTWLYAWIDVAIYPGLFATNVANLLRILGQDTLIESNQWIKWGVGLAIIVPFTWLNIRGTRKVGDTSVLMLILLLAPFVAMILLGMPKISVAAVSPAIASGKTLTTAIGGGLFTVMWNYLGWDSMSTVAEEVEEPQRLYPKALLIGVFAVTISYLLPTLVGLSFYGDTTQWKEGAWSTIATLVGGKALGIAIASAGMLSAAGLFSSSLLASSRIPFVLAEDRLLPAWLQALHARFGTPYRAILLSAIFYAVLSLSTFESLTVADVFLYSAAIALEFVALVVLRVREPETARPFRIKGGLPVVLIVAFVPIALVCFAIFSQYQEVGLKSIWMPGIAVLVSAAAYPLLRRLGSSRSIPSE